MKILTRVIRFDSTTLFSLKGFPASARPCFIFLGMLPHPANVCLVKGFPVFCVIPLFELFFYFLAVAWRDKIVNIILYVFRWGIVLTSYHDYLPMNVKSIEAPWIHASCKEKVLLKRVDIGKEFFREKYSLFRRGGWSRGIREKPGEGSECVFSKPA